MRNVKRYYLKVSGKWVRTGRGTVRRMGYPSPLDHAIHETVYRNEFLVFSAKGSRYVWRKLPRRFRLFQRMRAHVAAYRPIPSREWNGQFAGMATAPIRSLR